ncbi:hypothetical protein J8967_27425, partial [Klebsiella pneumoniae]
FIVGGPVGDFELLLCHGTVCVVGKMRDLILQLSKSSIYSTKPFQARISSACNKSACQQRMPKPVLSLVSISGRVTLASVDCKLVSMDFKNTSGDASANEHNTSVNDSHLSPSASINRSLTRLSMAAMMKSELFPSLLLTCPQS